MLHLGTPFSIPDLVEEHVEVLPLLFALREGFLRAEHVSARDLADHDERIDAHADGIVLAGDDAREALTAMLASDDPGAATAAAFVHARAGTPESVAAVLDAFAAARAAVLHGLADGLSFAPPEPVRKGLEGIAKPGGTAAAWAAARVLVSHGAATPELLRAFTAWPGAEEADATRAAVDLLAVLGVSGLGRLPLRDPSALLQPLLRAEDAALRLAAIEAAAWTKQSWLLDRCRAAAAAPAEADGELLRCFGVLAGPADKDRVLALASRSALGPLRYAVLGAYGHPAVVPALLEGMTNADAETAAAAGAAFLRVTGCDVESGTRARVAPAGTEPDEFEREFLEEVALPDPAKADAYWKERRKAFEAGTRWCRGVNLSDGSLSSAGTLALGLRHECHLRAAHDGKWGDGAFALSRFAPAR